MITPDVREAVLRRDRYQCRFGSWIADWHNRKVPFCTGMGEQIAHVLFHDRKGKNTPKEIRDWVDEEWNLAAICKVCNVDKRVDKTRAAREAHVKRMLAIDPEGFDNWWFRRPAKIYDKEIDRLIETTKGEQDVR